MNNAKKRYLLHLYRNIQVEISNLNNQSFDAHNINDNIKIL